MKNLAHIVLVILLTVTMASGQEEKKEYNKPTKGLHLAIGAHSIIPTQNVFFPGISEKNPDIFGQTLFNEWYSPSLGAYFDVSLNVGKERPFFIGFQHSTQYIMNDRNHINSNDPDHPEIGTHYYLTKQVSHRNNMLFAEAEFLNWRNFGFYGRGELGFAMYRGEAKVHTVGSPKALVNKTFRSGVFSAGLGLGMRYQINERFALRFLAGYRFETANNFHRRIYYSGLDASISPKDDGFYWQEIEESNDLIRPVRPRNQNLYFQFGIVHHFDGRDFNRSQGERGEPTYDPDTAKKPILYLYPEEETLVHVEVELTDHEFIFTYPEYPDSGWNVLAEPNGDLTDENTGRKYYSLFWETEGRPYAENIEEGYVVSGAETRAFLEEKLEHLGLNYKEANEFLIFWLPMMENNAYNAIYFAFEEYEALSKLKITPTPDTIIRLMMMFEGLDEPIDLRPQHLEKGPERKGFTAVEWGGMEGTFFNKNGKVLTP